MEKIIQFDNISINVAWDEEQLPGSVIHFGTGDPGLAMICAELFLDELGKQSLCYEPGFLVSDHHQDMNLKKSSHQDWAGWSRQKLFSRSNATPKTGSILIYG